MKSDTLKEGLSLLAETPPREGRLLSANELHLRAEEARAIAEAMHHPATKSTMLGLAKNYERLAGRAEQRER